MSTLFAATKIRLLVPITLSTGEGEVPPVCVIPAPAVTEVTVPVLAVASVYVVLMEAPCHVPVPIVPSVVIEV